MSNRAEQGGGLCKHCGVPEYACSCKFGTAEREAQNPEAVVETPEQVGLPEGVESHLRAGQFSKVGYKEYLVPEGVSIKERVQQVLDTSSDQDVVVTRDGKLMVKEVAARAVNSEGTRGMTPMKELDWNNPEDAKELSGVADFFDIKGQSRRDVIDREIVTGRLENVVLLAGNPDMVGFKYAE